MRIFWGCFTSDKNGPYHCWKPETAKEKHDSEREIQQLNLEIEPILQEQWELETEMRRVNIRRQAAGKKPTWRFNMQTNRLSPG